jgi:hypothetical protein
VNPRRTHERERRAYPDDRVCGGDTQPAAAVRMASPQLACTACTNDGIASVTPRRTHERERRAYPDDRVCGGDTQPVSAVRMASPQPATLHCVHERQDHEREPEADSRA